MMELLNALIMTFLLLFQNRGVGAGLAHLFAHNTGKGLKFIRCQQELL